MGPSRIWGGVEKSWLGKLEGEVQVTLFSKMGMQYAKKKKKKKTPMLIAALCTITKIQKQPKCLSVDGWIKQLWDIYPVEY